MFTIVTFIIQVPVSVGVNCNL